VTIWMSEIDTSATNISSGAAVSSYKSPNWYPGYNGINSIDPRAYRLLFCKYALRLEKYNVSPN